METVLFEGASLRLAGVATAPVVITIHGFADDSSAFTPLADTALNKSFRLVFCDLPGFGMSPAKNRSRIGDLAAFVLRLADAMSPSEPVGLMAHSVGSPIAVAAAHAGPERVGAILSIEGNLTHQDAYFSGRAAKYGEPTAFKAAFCDQVAAMAKENHSMDRYRAAVETADAQAMWELGKDAATLGLNDGFGLAYRHLAVLGIETLYLWGRHNSPSDTIQFVDQNQLANVEFVSSGHWKSVDDPNATGAIANRFFAKSLARH